MDFRTAKHHFRQGFACLGWPQVRVTEPIKNGTYTYWRAAGPIWLVRILWAKFRNREAALWAKELDEAIDRSYGRSP